MTAHVPNRQRHASPGYSLVELLLATALLLVFTGLAVVSLSALSQGSALTEGAIRFETLLRFARAQAAHSGHRVRVSFVQDTNAVASATTSLNHVELAWEPDPMGEPEVFQQLPTPEWGLDRVNEAVAVETVRLLQPAEPTPPASPDDEQLPEVTNPQDTDPQDTEPPLPPCVTFNPNGSCESAEITLASRNPDDERRVAVRIEGLTGSISRLEPTDKDPGTKPEPQDPQQRAAPAPSK